MMKIYHQPLLCAFCLSTALAFTNSTTQAQNILVDPGFETQTGWNLFNGAQYSTNYAHSGSWSMLDLTVNNVPGSFEQFAASPGQQYDLTGYALTPTALLGSPAFGILQISYFDSANNNLGTVETSPGNALTSLQINGATTPGVWTFLDTGIGSAPANTAYIQAFTLYVDFSGNNQGVYFDDLSLTQVTPAPEPASVALMGIGLLGICVAINRRSGAVA
jgi:PEP-CTERM motif-containing protein